MTWISRVGDFLSALGNIETTTEMVDEHHVQIRNLEEKMATASEALNLVKDATDRSGAGLQSVAAKITSLETRIASIDSGLASELTGVADTLNAHADALIAMGKQGDPVPVEPPAPEDPPVPPVTDDTGVPPSDEA